MPAPAPSKHSPARSSAKWSPRRGLNKMPWKEWSPFKWEEYIALKRKLGGITADLYLYICKNTVGDFKKGRPLECRFTDKHLAGELGCSEDAIRMAKRSLEKIGMLEPSTVRNRTFRPLWDKLHEFAQLPLPPPKTVNQPKCKKRTEPDADPELEVVAVETPIGTMNVSVTCPVHAKGHTLNYTTCEVTYVDNEEVTESEPRLESGLDDSPPPDFEPPDEPPTPAEVELTPDGLHAILSPTCIATFGTTAPAGDKLWQQTANNLETAENIPALQAMIAKADPKRIKDGKLTLGVIRSFATKVATLAKEGHVAPLPPRGSIPEREWVAMARKAGMT